MSYSTPSAWFPEMKRRPTISPAFTIPSAISTPISIQSSCRSFPVIALPITSPVTP